MVGWFNRTCGRWLTFARGKFRSNFFGRRMRILILALPTIFITLEQQGILDAALRERIIHHAMQLQVKDIDFPVIEGITRIMLSRRPEGQEALERMELLMAETDSFVIINHDGNMAQYVVVVESPAKAKTIEKYLGKHFKVMASYGHVRDLLPKEGAVDPDDNFAMKYQIDRNKNMWTPLLKP